MLAPSIFQRTERPVGIAHRGSRLLWPENTEVAFAGAAGHGYRIFETDLRVTADGVLVCFHDPILSRTTDGHGFVANTPFAELRRLDAGHRHRLEGGFPFRGKGIVVPTLAEMVKAFPNSGWVVDLKADGTETRLLEAIEELDLFGRVIVGSFSTERVERFRKLSQGRVATSTPPGETMRAMMAAAAPRWGRAGIDVFDATTAALQVPATWYGVPVVTASLVELAHRAGRLIHVWTVNSSAEMETFIEMGVDGLITDRPDLLLP